ncbi:class I SAM-dependent methyltransferase [Bacillus sp. FJAT-42376]|uniref:class I SAM-dependent DNA methyltransferase n=1 Tax=Bacillus sp. FJAT-42376 TaxID=2014076 RepID=UPI000F4F7B4C|nr:class I SAM-dependent methyltransferase [Bacillus sp. FJAT-42376]AZB43695.1 class I SAM-dependent methyltransferase [Bacillus sp. FJAT-42376]
MIYQGFAGVYDHLMEDVPYQDWAKLLDEMIRKYGNTGRRVLDVACGTGEIAVLLQEKGYEMSGADLSEEMLALAIQKAEEKKMSIPFFQQDMREMEGHDRAYDAVMINCDSLNYLLEDKDVQQTFKAAAGMLRDEGLFLFDVHSIYKMEHVLKGSTFADADEDVSLIWQCFEGEKKHSVEHELTFFVKDAQQSYSRIDEFHQQRTYPPEQIKLWLKDAGFEILAVFGDFKPGTLDNQAERLFFAAKKTNT